VGVASFVVTIGCADMSEHTGLHRRFHAHGIHVGLGQGQLARVMVPGENSAELYLHGAHLTHWQPAGERPVLWLSPHSAYAEGKPIRGGIPICFPWFGAHAQSSTLPMHGFARLHAWELKEVERVNEDEVKLHLHLGANDKTRSSWPFGFEINYHIAIGPVLDLNLEVTNSGGQSFEYGEALHTYFAIGDIATCRIHGLADCDYLDKTRNFSRDHEGRPLITISGEIDRQYQSDRGRCEIEDPTWKRRVVIEKSHSAVTVVWNPGPERAKNMPDVEPTGYRDFVCVESANAGSHLVRLEPGQSHQLRTRISVHPL
jgi:glucose-6-phosphate 1-epimerase